MLIGMPLLNTIEDLVCDIAAAAEQTERNRAVPEPIVARLAEIGVFRLAAPKAVGGLELDPVEMCEVFERLGQADGATGWCSMIAGATSLVFHYLDPVVAGEMLDDPRCLIAGVAAPTGQAVAVSGGYRVTGRWAFASASQQATWLVGGCVTGSGPRFMVMPRDEVTIHDTWDAVGLCGTGSHDMSAEDVFVPEARTFSFAQPPRSAHGAFPAVSFLAAGIGAVALGIARAAIDEFIGLAAGKLDPLSGLPLAAKPAAQVAIAKATTCYAAGRAFLHDELHRCWKLASAGQPADVAQVARLRLAITNATTTAAEAVGRLYRAAGGSSVFRSSPLQRQFRDINVVTQHGLVNADSLELTGAVLLGQAERVGTARL